MEMLSPFYYRWAFILIFVLPHALAWADDPVLPADHVLSRDGVQIFKMDPPTPEQCQNVSTKLNGKPMTCDYSIPQVPQEHRDDYFRYILQAANSADGVNPALILASIAVETSLGGPLSENSNEMAAYKALQRKMRDENLNIDDLSHEDKRKFAVKWGKGLGQFGANNAESRGLDWYAKKPADEKTCWTEAYNKTDPSTGLYPIWSPWGAILAKSKHLKISWEGQYTDRVRDKQNQPTDDSYRVDHTYRFDPSHFFRYVAGMYNRGLMPINSLKEGYRQFSKLPGEYAQAWWAVLRRKDTPPKADFQILAGEDTNRCHVFKINRLCGLGLQGHMQFYEQYFVYKDGKWIVKK